MGREFARAEGIRVQVTNEQAKQIRNLYEELSNEYKERARILSNKTNISSQMREQYLKDYVKDLERDIEFLNGKLESTITSNMLRVAEAVVDDSLKLDKEMGFGGIMTKQFYIPQDVVAIVTSGQLYSGKWSLSGAIWGTNQKQLKDINSIVAKGIAGNKSSYEIAKDLERYVNPRARKEWNWNKVYPNTSKKIDYNAQRLARTMVAHAYQESFVESTKDNPFIESYRWLASGGDRMCPICADRDGQIYSKDDLPMDHPNGMCTFEVVIEKSYEEIGRELADWVNGEGDPELNEALDNYADSLGFNVKAMTANTESVQNAKESIASGSNVVDGQDISGTWQRRSDEFDFEIDDVINAQGFDGLPRVVSAEEFDRFVKEANDGNGFIAQRTYSAPDQETLDAYRQQLYEGKWYVDCSTGGAQYGQGMYCAADYNGQLTQGIQAEMKHYIDLNKGRTEEAAFLAQLNVNDVNANTYMRQQLTQEQFDAFMNMKVNGTTIYGLSESERKVLEGVDIGNVNFALSEMRESFKETYKGFSHVETMTLDKSAKIVDYDKIFSEFSLWQSEADVRAKRSFIENMDVSDDLKAVLRGQTSSLRNDESFNSVFGIYGNLSEKDKDIMKDKIPEINKIGMEASMASTKIDVGSYAALKGYDAINAVGHGESGSYTVVLNRTKLIIKGE